MIYCRDSELCSLPLKSVDFFFCPFLLNLICSPFTIFIFLHVWS